MSTNIAFMEGTASVKFLSFYICFSLRGWTNTDLFEALPVHEITVNISDIVNLGYSVGFTTTAVYLSYLRQITMAVKILYILQRFRISEVVYTTNVLWRGKFCIYTTAVQNFRSRIYDNYTMAGKILFLLQRFRIPRHRNCDNCTMAGTYSIYYCGTVYPPPSHLRRRKTNSGEDLMLAG